MRKILNLLIGLIVSSLSFGQWSELPMGDYDGLFMEKREFFEMNNNEFLLAYNEFSGDKKLDLHLFDGTNWNALTNSGLDSNVISFKTMFNKNSDTLFIGYTKSDGFYFRMFTSGGFTPTLFQSTSTGISVWDMQGTIDTSSNEAYFVVHASGSDSKIFKYDSQLNNLVSYPMPGDLSSSRKSTRLVKNPMDEYLYISYTNENAVPVIKRYNNISWSSVDVNVSAHSVGALRGSFLEYNSDADALDFCYLYSDGTNLYYGINQYDYSNNNKIELVALTEYGADAYMEGQARSNNFYFFDLYPATLMADSIFYVGVDDFSFTNENRHAHYFDSDGSYYFMQQVSNKIYKRDPFVLGEFEHELQAFPIVYPNPAESRLQLDVTEEHELSIFNLSGEVVVAPQPYQPNQELDIQFLPAGLYILKLKNQSGTIHHQRFVVE